MNIASLDLCKELYQLSGWGQECYWWHTEFNNHSSPEAQRQTRLYELVDAQELADYEGRTYLKDLEATPAYDLGYLLRRLPQARLTGLNPGWSIQNALYGNSYVADTPENAAANLCIELIKQGVLK